MRSETDEALTRSQRPSGGGRTPLLNGRLYGWRHSLVSRTSEQPFVRWWECVMRGAGGTAPFFEPLTPLVVLSRWRRPVVEPHVSFRMIFGEGAMRRTMRGWDLSFFWQLVKDTDSTADRLKRRGWHSWRVQRFGRVRPLVAGGTPCRIFCC